MQVGDALLQHAVTAAGQWHRNATDEVMRLTYALCCTIRFSLQSPEVWNLPGSTLYLHSMNYQIGKTA